MRTIALVIGGLALAFFLAVSFRQVIAALTKPRVRARVLYAARAPNGVVTARPGGVSGSEPDESADARAEPGVLIDVENAGRHAATIGACWMRFAGILPLLAPDPAASVPLPCELEPHASVTWFVPATALQEIVAAHGSEPRAAWAEITLATGAVIRAKGTTVIAP